MSIIKDAKHTFRFGNMINRLILVNVVVFLLFIVLYIISNVTEDKVILETAYDWLGMPYNLHELLLKPWTLITNLFVHADPQHILWNMLFLFWFGSIFGDLAGDRRVLPLYLYAGIFGSVLSLGVRYAMPNTFVGAEMLIGASGAVNAMLFAATTLSPDYKVRMLFIGNISIKYVALFYAVVDLAGMSGPINAGGHAAHVGGALFGWFYVTMLRRGFDMSAGFNRAIDSIKNFFDNKPQPKVRVTYRRPNTSNADFNALSRNERQRRVDEILDKISKSGYDSLTKEEKEILFKASKD